MYEQLLSFKFSPFIREAHLTVYEQLLDKILAKSKKDSHKVENSMLITHAA